MELSGLTYYELLDYANELQQSVLIQQEKIEEQQNRIEKITDKLKKGNDIVETKPVVKYVEVLKEPSKPTFEIPFGNYNASLIDGKWIYKANEQGAIETKKDKPVYQEKPQFELQNEIEGYSKNRFNKVAGATVIEITKFLKENLNDTTRTSNSSESQNT